jgi:hypothetical protein
MMPGEFVWILGRALFLPGAERVAPFAQGDGAALIRSALLPRMQLLNDGRYHERETERLRYLSAAGCLTAEI